MSAFINHFSFEFRTGIRNRTLLLMNYLFPLGFYLMMGFIMPAINPLFLDTLIPALVVFAILAATLLGMPDPLVSAREEGIFRSYKINGIPSISILTIPALTTILHLMIVVIIITVTAPFLFDAPLPMNWVNYALTFIAMAVACVGISLLIGVISASTRMTVLWSQLIFIPSMLLGGLMIPYDLLPDVAGKFSQLLPATHAMNAFNGLAMGAADYSPWGAPWGSVIVLTLSGVLAFALAIYMFNWDRHNTTQRGHPIFALLALLPYVAGIFLL
ncbi:MAG: ABC transporter permease [Anaerolineaceae bacterium]|nr:MAG: ABC transporter permease [Anaerolineaceae bacterium]